jgi:antitoxin (DNA-binding transcriptional repressor) of toxin-antitoxin stability system
MRVCYLCCDVKGGQDMSIVKINEAKDQFEELISRAEAGETILIEKDGKTIVKLEGVETHSDLGQRKKIDVTALEEFTRSQPLQKESAGDFIRRMRDEDRY